MALADYSHWNEEAPMIWWEEEGKHYDSEPSYFEDDDPRLDYEPDPDEVDEELRGWEITYDEWMTDDSKTKTNQET